MEFSPSPATDPNIFHPRLDLETSPEGWRAELLTVPESWRCTCGIFTKTRRLSKHFSPRLELQSFPDGWRPELLIPGAGCVSVRDFHPRRLSKHCPTAPGVVDFSRNWRPARVRFPPSRGTNPDIFCPLLESLAFPYEKWSPCGFFTKPGAKLGIFCTLLWTAGFSAGLRVWYFHRRRVVFWHL